MSVSEPQRRCITCRANDHKQTLLRFGLIAGTVCFDLRQKLPGRGFYVCAERKCLEKAFAGGFKRAARGGSLSELGPDADTFVRTTLLPGTEKRYREILLAGFQSRQLLCGSEAVEEAARQDGLACYLLARDASESTQKKYRSNALRKSLPVLGLICASEYGQLLGKSDKTVLGWVPGKLYQEFFHLESAILRLSEEFGITL